MDNGIRIYGLLAACLTWGRRLAYTVAAFGVFILIAVATAWLFLKTPLGEGLVADAIIGTLERDGTIAVSIGDVEGDLPQTVTLRNVVIGDNTGPWLTVDQVTATWTPWAVLTGRVIVDAVDAGNVTLSRWPHIAASPTGGSEPLDLDATAALLSRLRVERFTINRLTVAADVVGRDITARVDAALTRNGNERPELSIAVADSANDAVLNASVTVARQQRIRFEVQAGGYESTVHAAGSVNVQTGFIDGRADVSLAPLLLNEDSPVHFTNATADVSVTGSVAEPQFDMGYVVTQPQVNAVAFDRLDGVAEGVWREGQLTVTSAGGVRDVTKLAPGAAPLMRPDLLFDVAAAVDLTDGSNGGPLLRIASATFESGDVSATTTAEVDLGTLSGSGSAAISAAGLGRLFGRKDESSQTTISLDNIAFGSSALTADVSGQTGALAGQDDVVFALFGDEVTVTADLMVSGDAVSLQNGSVGSQAVSLATDIAYDVAANRISAQAGGTLEITPALNSSLSGTVSLTAQADGSLLEPVVFITLTSDALLVRQETFRDVGLSLESDLTVKPIQVTLSGRADVAEGPLNLTLNAGLEAPDRVNVYQISLTGDEIAVKGAASLSLPDQLVLGSVDFQFESLALPSALAGVPLAGSANGQLTLDSEDDQQVARWTLQAQGVRYAGAVGGVRTLSVTGEWQGGADATLAATVNGQRVFVGTRTFDDVDLSLSGLLSDLNFIVNTKPESASPAVSAVGQVGFGAQSTTISLDTFSITDAWGTFALTAPGQVRVSPDQLAVDAFSASMAGGAVNGRATIDRTQSTVDLSLSGETLPFAALKFLDPDLPVAGQFDFAANLKGELANPEGTFTVRATDVALPETGLEDVAAQLNLTLRSSQLSLEGQVTGLSDTPAKVSGHVPLVLDLTQNQTRLPLDEPISLTVDWSGPIEPVWSVLPLVTHRLNGTGRVALSVEGSLGAPLFTGSAELSDGTYENLDLGTVLQDVTIDIAADDTVSLNLILSADDGEDGFIQGNGFLTRDAAGEITGDMTLSMAQVRLARRDDIKIRGSGELDYTLTSDRDQISGDIIVDSADVSLNASYVDPIPTLDVLDPDAPPPPRDPRAGKETDLDIRLSAPADLVIAGRGLESEWSADMTVGGTLAAPELGGSLNLLRGEFAFLGELFPLNRGQISFTGGGRIDPELDLVAARTSGGFTAQVVVDGRASAPGITLTSDPPLPEDEVLARLLFGKSAGQLGPLEAVQLANAATELSGLSGRGGVVGSLRRSVGLDVFSFGSNDNGNTVVVGQRLSRNIFVGVEQGLEGQGSEVIIEWQLTDTLALSSAINQETGSDIGLQWSRDY